MCNQLHNVSEALAAKRPYLWEMGMVPRVQIMDEAVWIFYGTNTFAKCINATILTPANGKE